jgi:beta-glucosidase
MPIDIDAVVAALNLDDKVRLLAGADNWHTHALPGVPAMRCSDGPAGVRGTSWTGPASASFPCGTALGATWDPALVREVGVALGREAHSKGANVLLAPTVNLHRTPIGGRNFECMSEDPVLTAHIAREYVLGVQSTGVAACIKHLVGNDTEHERMTISSDIDERTLREVYLLPFEVACRPVDDGGAGVWSMMAAYNRLNGTFCSEHAELLDEIVRGEWGWQGALISDWFGTHSAASSLRAGLDLEMPGPARERGDALLAAVLSGEVDGAYVDRSVRRLLTLFRRTGVGETPTDEVTDDSPDTREVIRRAAIAGSVLLRNDDALPLPDGRVALIGPNSRRGQVQGGGSARVRANRPVALLDALTASGLAVRHAEGCSIAKRLPTLRGEFEVHYRSGDTTATAPARQLQFLWMDDPAPGIRREQFTATIAGTFVPDVSGEWAFGLTVVGPAVLTVNGHTVVDLSEPQVGGSYFGNGSPEVRGTIELAEGEPAVVHIECGSLDQAMLRGLTVGGRGPATGDPIEAAVALAADSEVAVVVVGTDADWETEGEDRVSMDLPGRQNELVQRVAAANSNTVVVVNAGSPVTMPWFDQVAAVLLVWFPGEEIGNAVADMLTGAAEPGGRLPMTIPLALEDTPAFAHYPGRDGHAVYAEGPFIGYRWYQREQRAVRAAFGSGMGYTTWQLGSPSLEGSMTDGVTVRVPVTNTGERDGSQLVQVYVQPPDGDHMRPLRTLQGFAKVVATPGATEEAVVWLPERAFSVWSVDRHDWTVPPGLYTVWVGSSSDDLQSAGTVRV